MSRQKFGIFICIVFLFTLAGVWRLFILLTPEPVERMPRGKKPEHKEWSFNDDISGIDLSVIAEEPMQKEKSREVRRLERLIRGEWYLTRRYTSYEKRFFRYSGSKKGQVTLSDNMFVFSSAGIDFYGEFQVVEPILLGSVSANISDADQFLLHVMNMSSSMSLGVTPHVYYWGEVRGEKLILSKLGSHISRRLPPEEVLYFER